MKHQIINHLVQGKILGRILIACLIKLIRFKSGRVGWIWNQVRDNSVKVVLIQLHSGKVVLIQVSPKELWFCKSIKTCKMNKMHKKNQMSSNKKNKKIFILDLSKSLTKERMTLKAQ